MGMKGSRMHSIVRELQNENIDVINYTDNKELLIARALSPAKITRVVVNAEAKTAAVYLQPDQVSLAIGKGGLNIKLASKLAEVQLDVYRDSVSIDEDDVSLDEFSDELDAWVIDELQRIGLDTAKTVLALNKEELLRRTDLEEETVDEILNILSAEFEEE